eukprot:1563086-Amphidinium_carterae.2
MRVARSASMPKSAMNVTNKGMHHERSGRPITGRVNCVAVVASIAPGHCHTYGCNKHQITDLTSKVTEIENLLSELARGCTVYTSVCATVLR